MRNSHNQALPLEAVFCEHRWVSLFIWAFAFFILSGSPVHGGENENREMEPKWALTLYGGPSAQEDLGDVLGFQASFPDDSYIAVVALARELWRYEEWVGLEAEGQVGKHFGEMNHWELNGLLVGRWHPFWWDRYLETSLGVGDGLSYATEVPEVEQKDGKNGEKLLNYLLFELTFGLPQYSSWDLAVRVHHRSGMFGLFGGVHGAADFVCGGLKYHF